MTRVMAFGTFDRLHAGHRYYLQQAKRYGDELIVVVARDATVRRVKGHPAQQSEVQRLASVQRVASVDRAVLGSVGDKYDVVRQHRPEVICLGYDQQAFTDQLPKLFPELKIVRLGAYQPERYKSSRLRGISPGLSR